LNSDRVLPDNWGVQSRRVTPGRLVLLALVAVFVFLALPRHVHISGYSFHLRPGWEPYVPYMLG
jgi:hypothetical protein